MSIAIICIFWQNDLINLNALTGPFCTYQRGVTGFAFATAPWPFLVPIVCVNDLKDHEGRGHATQALVVVCLFVAGYQGLHHRQHPFEHIFGNALSK